jgi:chaperonin GroES
MAKYNFTVLGARCVVEKDKQAEQTSSGIVLPTKSQEEVYIGTVITVGTGHYTETGVLIPMTVKAGDRVIFAKFAGVPVRSGSSDKDSDYLVINERDVIAIVEVEPDGE